MEGLFPYRGTFEPTSLSIDISTGPADSTSIHVPVSVALHARPSHTDQIEAVLDDKIVASRNGGHHRFFVKWSRRPPTDASWITDEKFRSLILIFWSSTSTVPLQRRVLFGCGEMMGNGLILIFGKRAIECGL